MFLGLDYKKEKGKLYFRWRSKPSEKDYPLGGFPCRALCDKPLKRPHFSCLFCGMRRSYYGKIPEWFRAEARVFLMSQNGVKGRALIIPVAKNKRLSKVRNVLFDILAKVIGIGVLPRKVISKLRLVTFMELLSAR